MEKKINEKKNKKKEKFSFSVFYSNLIVDNPIKVLIIAVIISIISFGAFSSLKVENSSVDEIIPVKYPVADAMQKLKYNLGGGENTAFMVVLEIDPQVGSTITDIRDPEVLKYSMKLSKQILKVEDITGVSGIGTLTYSLNENVPVNDLQTSKEIIKKNSETFSRVVNDKYTLSIIRVNANEGFDVGILENEVQKIIDNTNKPRGVKTLLAGESIARKISEDLTGPDSGKTTMISLIAIVFILLFTFRSLLYGGLPMFTIIFGVLWTFGFIAISGTRFSNISSGAIAMIMGIGIDFGIQTIMRFQQELASDANPVSALKHTMQNVLKPMFITTVASFLGFYAMTLGDVTILKDLGITMAFGVTFCFLAAITVVPAILILWEKNKESFSFKNKILNIKNYVGK